ncbi:hypothetical protein ACFQ6U_14140 [Streptomyces sp. NPDC056465]|uniref:hypothetical protein n=1 Tax=unclassified Streptomyces TaxID=2593676 RepID=UPI0035DF45F7
MTTLASTLMAALPSSLAGLITDDGVVVHPSNVPSADAMKGAHVLIGAYAAMEDPAPEYAVLGARAYRHGGDTSAANEVYYGDGIPLLVDEVARVTEATSQWFARHTLPTAGQRLTAALAAPGIRTHADGDAGNTWLVIATDPDVTVFPDDGRAYLVAYVHEAHEDWVFVDTPMELWAGRWTVTINDGNGRERELWRGQNTGDAGIDTAECALFIARLLKKSPR